MTKQALVLESNPRAADEIALHIRKAGFTAILNTGASQSLAMLEREQPDLVILDLMSPNLDGVKISQQIRQQNERVPILFLASQSKQLNHLLEQDITGADYLIKPLNPATLVSRIRALIHRVDALNQKNNANANRKVLVFDQLKIDTQAHTVETLGGIFDLTPREFDLLMFLAASPGRTFKRARLLEAIRRRKHKGSEHTVNTHISRLRYKNRGQPPHDRNIFRPSGESVINLPVEFALNQAHNLRLSSAVKPP